MKIVISTTVSMPIYEQIINQIRDAVVSGELKAGDGMPSIRVLATSAQCFDRKDRSYEAVYPLQMPHARYIHCLPS